MVFVARHPVKNITPTMDKRVVIQTSSTSGDGQGGITETWADGATVWASIEPLKGYEKFQAMQLETPCTHKVMMRYRDDVTTKIRLKFGTRVFNVKEATNLFEQKTWMRLLVLEMQ